MNWLWQKMQKLFNYVTGSSQTSAKVAPEPPTVEGLRKNPTKNMQKFLAASKEIAALEGEKETAKNSLGIKQLSTLVAIQEGKKKETAPDVQKLISISPDMQNYLETLKKIAALKDAKENIQLDGLELKALTVMQGYEIPRNVVKEAEVLGNKYKGKLQETASRHNNTKAIAQGSTKVKQKPPPKKLEGFGRFW